MEHKLFLFYSLTLKHKFFLQTVLSQCKHIPEAYAEGSRGIICKNVLVLFSDIQ